ncbi:hypothetical protein HVY60_09045 [Citrobacter freundii]|uniref:hypothetical protein n=1 Tax=Citrobacter freundii TaxID=546 RepID=UPI0015EFA8DB|nr:hypothetical protein [Citrobacter freundii]QMG40717.1 hypothetical protein HVY60_09045 [Citrobacter freundii]
MKMATGVPQEKATQLLELYGNMLLEGMSIDEFSYRRGVRELENQSSNSSISALGFLHALYGNTHEAITTFEAFDMMSNSTLATNYCFMLRHTGCVNLLNSKIYAFADAHRSKTLSCTAYSMAYRFGDRERLIHYMDMHIKLLSEDENRAGAEKHKLELLSEVDGAYSLSGCTSEQFHILASIIWGLTEKHRLITGYVEVSKKRSPCYVVDVPDKDADFIATLNWELAQEICNVDALDDCGLVARFSPSRELHSGISYASE